MRGSLSRRGLTLIEMLITITVLGVAVAMVIPSMSQTGVLGVQAAARTIASDIAYAQTEAMSLQERRAVYFGAVPNESGTGYVSGNGYVLLNPTGSSIGLSSLQDYALAKPEAPSEAFCRVFDDEMTYGGAVIESASFDSGQALIFDELGGPLADLTGSSPGSGGTVTLTADQYGLEYAIRVEGMTGRVVVERIGG